MADREVRNRLDHVLADLGSTVLTPVLPGRPEAVAGAPVIHDPAEPLDLAPGALLLGVGLREPERVAGLLTELGGLGAAALLVKAPAPVSEAVRVAAEAAGVAVLEVSAAASWSHVLALLQSRLAADETALPDGALPLGNDLFALANAIAALLDAPVVIEDRSSRVLAYSEGQDTTDPGRVATVLGRQVPEELQRELRAQGVFREVYRSAGPVHVDLGGDTIPRAAIAVRAGEEILGSIWAAIRSPLSPARATALADAAKIVALHLMRQRAGADVQRRLRADLLATVLEGGPDAAEAANRLGVAGESLCVLAARARAEGGQAEQEAATQRLCDALSLHLRTTVARPTAAAPQGGVVYGLLPVPADGAAARIAEDFLARTGTKDAVRIGIGRVVAGWPEVPRSRRDADAVLRALAHTRRAGPVARLADVHVELMLTRLADQLAVDRYPVLGPVAVLLAHDAEHGTEFVLTLGAYLDSFGDVSAAARRIHVHPNTFRYRIRRLAEISGLDFGDSRARLGAHLQLQLREL
ncbi:MULTISPECIES: CdaR family transcriptional regulator [unclassified Crossiella]|uniref:PucR family transcriptional regulator n=1 Tax=unclassified Crossiella TaxID=2620835 RepID=UPI001FFEDFFE|nr:MULTISPECIES: helix-turn-helix domain-containing protein [unclassified Crossiella]MCK2242739.1 helix-turn-helix domain-containing protein [Crossiella sp. S99.2]MCK2256616.1 helix-turn-helix domain-containing protein [Crossiella sp. S99.1]